jgi:arginase family enzyme
MSDPFFTPVSGMDLPRFAGVATFMRLPLVPEAHDRASEVEIGIVGLPWDGGTSNRPGARHGPRALRDASTMVRAEQETENEANRLREQVDAALIAVASRSPDEVESLQSAAARIERAARDLADALRQLAQQRRVPEGL